MSESTREIITIQAGHYANFVGTHWWNFQEASFVYSDKTPTDLNHDYFFQAGLTQKREETFTPRLLMLDTMGSLGSLHSDGTLYDDDAAGAALETTLWDQDTVTVSQLPHPKNDFLTDLEQEENKLKQAAHGISGLTCSERLEPPPPAEARTAKVFDLRESVHYWSDYLRPHLHPSTVCLLPGVWHWQVAGCAAQQHAHQAKSSCSSDASDQLWSYNSGYDAANCEATYDTITDTLRRMAERCNSLQGFQLVCHGFDGMGGVGSGVCQHLRAEYGSKSVMVYPVSPPTVSSLCRRTTLTPLLVNTLMTYSSLCDSADLLVPLNLRQHPWRPDAALAAWPHYRYTPGSAYETSSVLAMFLECSSTALRTKDSPLSMAELVHFLTPRQKKLVAGSLHLPAPASLDMPPAGVGVSGGQEAPPPYEGLLLTRRGHACAAPEGITVRQARDPLDTAAPFPTQLFAGLPQHSAGTVGSVSCQAALQQGAASGVFTRQLLRDCEQLARPHRLNKLPGLGDLCVEDWQQQLQQWRELVECYGGAEGDDDTDSD